MSSTFSFTTAGSEYIHTISENILLHLCRSSHSVAMLDFTDQRGNKIHIPTGFMVYTTDYQSNQPVIQKPIGNVYALCWTDDYTIMLHDQLLFHIKNNRTWDITS